MDAADSRRLIEIFSAFLNHHISGREKIHCAKYIDK
jgi:hypothetical protein